MSGLDIKLPTGGGASGSNPTVTPLGNVNAQAAARAGSAYSQAYSYLSTVFNNGSQQLNFEEGRLAANKMSAAQRNALNSLLVSMGYANAKNQQQLQSHYDEFLGEYRKGLAANSNLTLYGMVAGTINGGQWNTTPNAASGTKHYFVPPAGTAYDPNSNTFQVSPAGVTNPSGSSQASTLDSVELEMENWGFSEKTIKAMSPRIVSAIAGGVDNTKGIDVWLREQPEYAQQFPGNITRMKNNLPPLAESTYTSYVQAMQEAGRSAGLPAGFLTNQEIGTLIANEVKPTEFTKRLTTAYEAVQQANPTVLQALQENFGLTPGHLAAWALDPKKATDLIAQQVQEAKYMAETQAAGFNQGMGVEQAQNIYQYAQTAGLSEASVRSGIDTAARYQSLEGSAPGQARAGLTQEQLIGSQVGGDAGAKQAFDIARAQQMTPMQGGGGDIMNAKGVTGAGFATGEGTAPVR